jgi:hypothetical protein
LLNYLEVKKVKKVKKPKAEVVEPESHDFEKHVDFMIQPETSTPKIDTSK